MATTKEARPEAGGLVSDQPPTEPLTFIDKLKGSQRANTNPGMRFFIPYKTFFLEIGKREVLFGKDPVF